MINYYTHIIILPTTLKQAFLLLDPVCVCVCVLICIYIRMHIYIHIYTYVHFLWDRCIKVGLLLYWV